MMEKKSQLGAGTILERGEFLNNCFSSFDVNPPEECLGVSKLMVLKQNKNGGVFVLYT